LRNRGVAARLPLSVSSFAGSINGARTVVNSLALRASAGAYTINGKETKNNHLAALILLTKADFE
jgi:hypothetical protein